MNMYTREIAEMLKVSLENAREIQTQMEYNGVDFSECSAAKLKKEAKLAAAELAA